MVTDIKVEVLVLNTFMLFECGKPFFIHKFSRDFEYAIAFN